MNFRYQLLTAISGHANTFALFFLYNIREMYFVPFWMDNVWYKICGGSSIAFLLIGFTGLILISVLKKKDDGSYKSEPKRKLNRLCVFLYIVGFASIFATLFMDCSFRNVTGIDGSVASAPYPSMEQTIAIGITFACFVLETIIDIASIIKKSPKSEERGGEK